TGQCTRSAVSGSGASRLTVDSFAALHPLSATLAIIVATLMIPQRASRVTSTTVVTARVMPVSRAAGDLLNLAQESRDRGFFRVLSRTRSTDRHAVIELLANSVDDGPRRSWR